MRGMSLLSACLVTVLILTSIGEAQSPMISYQGKLTDGSGTPLNGSHSIQFSIYGQSFGGTALWTETQSAVTVQNGIFNILLGSVTPIPTSLFNGSARWLGLKVGGDAEMSPRQQMASVGYALMADKANEATHADTSVYADDADMVDGQHASAFLGRTDKAADADRLDGKNSSAFAEADHSHSSLDASDGSPINAVYVDNSGKVGIGTASPQYKLDVNGIIQVTSDEQAYGIWFKNTGFHLGDSAFETIFRLGDPANYRVFEVKGHSDFIFDNVNVYPDDDNTLSLGLSSNRWASLHAVNAYLANGYFDKAGIGTTSPDKRLEIQGVEGNDACVHLDAWWNPEIFLDAGGYDADGKIHFQDRGSDRWIFYYDGSEGDLNFSHYTSGTVLYLDSSGRVGIGTATPGAYKLYVNGSLAVNSSTADKTGGGSWGTLSDSRLKTITGTFDTGLDELVKLQPVRYRYKENNDLGVPSDKEHIGFAAQDVQKLIPEAVREGQSGYLVVDNDPILWTMLNAIKEQQKQIDKLQSELAALKSHHGTGQ